MKKLFTTAIAICLILSFSLTSFASVSVTHIYKGKSLIEGDLNEYIFTFAKYDGDETPEAFGLIIDGEKYPLEESGIPSAQTMKRFGIGIADAENTLTDVFKVTPYVTVNGEDILGEEQIIDKSFLYEKMESFFAGYATDVICDDTNSKTSRFSDWYTPSGIYMQTNIHNGLGLGYNEALNRALIQLDLTKFDGVDATKPVILSVVGRAQYSVATSSPETLPESFTVNAYGFYEFDWAKSMRDYVAPEEGEEDTTEPVYEWSEDVINPSAGYVGPRLEDIYKMPLLDSFTVEVPENTDNKTSGDVVAPTWTTYEVDVKDIVAAALKAGKTKATIVLLADNREREEIPNKDADGNTLARDEVILNMGTTENTTVSRRPAVTFYRYNEEYVNLENIEVNGVAVSGFDAETTEYTVGYSKGENLPVVTAKTLNEESRAVVTQATAEDKTATIVVYDEQNIRSKTYKVTFVSSTPSTAENTGAAITADAHSRVGETAPTAISMNTNLYNGVPYVSGWEGSLKRAYMQVSLAELKDIDLTKNVYLNISAQTTINDTFKTALCPTSLNVNVYAAMKSDFEWDEATAATVTASSFGPNITQMKNLLLTDVVTVASESYNAGYLPYQVDITAAVKKAIENKEEYVTLMFSADNSERNTEELQALKNENSNNRDNITFTILTKERTVESQKPYVTYSKYNAEYTELSAIAVNGEAIEGFEGKTFSYTAKVEDGAEAPVVSATAFDSDASVEIEQPSEENGYVATITVSNSGMASKVYTVAIETTKSSELAVAENVITDDATSRVSYSAPDATLLITNISNGAGPGWESALRRAYVQIDLTKFADRDETKKVYLNVTQYVDYQNSRLSENAPSELKIDVYGVKGSEFVWNETTAAAVTENTFGPNIATTQKLPLLDSYTIEVPAKSDSSWTTGEKTQKAVDITAIVNSAIEAGETKATVIFMADNTTRTPLDKTLPDDINYKIFSKEDATRAPYVSYYKYDAKYTSLASIEINGEAIADFDAATLSYTAKIEDGAAIPVVTAKGFAGAEIAIEQPSAENGYVATITVANEGMTSKVYTVEFETTKASAVVNLTDIITADGTSRVSYGETDATTMHTNINNGAGAGWEGTLRRAYVQLDLTKFADRDISKGIALNFNGYITYMTERRTENAPENVKIDVYGAKGSEFTWSEAEKHGSTDSNFGPNITETGKLPLIESFTVAVPGPAETSWTTSETAAQVVDITSFVEAALAEGETTVNIIFMADNTSRKQYASTPSDEVRYVIFTKEDATRYPYVSYYKFDSKYTDLASIEIAGEAIADFDAADFEYEASFEEIDGVPAVSATAADKNAVVTIDQATEANGYIVTITVANEGVTSKTYKVVFTKKASSSEVTVLSAITADSHSRVGERDPYNIAMSTNLYNGCAYASGLEGTLKRGYLQISLAELKDIDLTKDVYLNIKASSSYNEAHITEFCPSEYKVNVYAAMKSEFSWSEEIAAAVEENTFGPNLTQMKALPLVTALTVAKPVEDTNSGYQAYNINITEVIRAAKAADEEYVTFMFSADNSERNTAELQALKAENSNNRDNLTFTILTKEYSSESMRPSVTYFAYDKAE